MNILRYLQEALNGETLPSLYSPNELHRVMHRQLLTGLACIVSGVTLVMVHVLHLVA